MDYIAGREHVFRALQRELFGPAPSGHQLDTAGSLVFADNEAARGPWVDAASGEEILQRDSPTKRYGVGVLYPAGTRADNGDGAP